MKFMDQKKSKEFCDQGVRSSVAMTSEVLCDGILSMGLDDDRTDVKVSDLLGVAVRGMGGRVCRTFIPKWKEG